MPGFPGFALHFSQKFSSSEDKTRTSATHEMLLAALQGPLLVVWVQRPRPEGISLTLEPAPPDQGRYSGVPAPSLACPSGAQRVQGQVIEHRDCFHHSTLGQELEGASLVHQTGPVILWGGQVR
ncbi:hypothetical protein KIL84_012058 [Mauremys mutica]|uniref:Uncharacterized protein n=1 Tax=Mauremys mutica TaxID=74926 RepID=A0A9D3XET0_9SAUR|nr:hypothetical protein KIL84_012058 [Mauremys mutica]